MLTSLPASKRPKFGKLIKNGEDEDLDIVDQAAFEGKGYVQGPIDPIFGQRRAFPITLELQNVDPTRIPESVNEYLAQVRLQACEMNLSIDDIEESDDEYCYYKPQKTDSKDEMIVPLVILENSIEKYKVRRKNYENYRIGIEELDAIDLPQTAKAWKEFIWEVSCERDYVAQIVEEGEHVKLLVYFTKWMSLRVDENFKEWLFGILEAIEEVLPSSELSVLRQLGKKVLRQYEQSLKLNQSENLEIYTRILGIIGIFYKQRDLLVKSVN